MFQYHSRKRSPSLKLKINAPTIPMGFWDELFKAQKQEWPSIVRKYSLNVEQLNYVAANREAVFGRKRASEESSKAWHEAASRCYAKYSVRV